ncbi:MAG: hypothetical protein ACLGIS_13190, partial [Actinomycetes bacterium]
MAADLGVPLEELAGTGPR